MIFKTVGVQGSIRNLLSKIPGVVRAFIYGSFAKNSERAGSDVDLCLVLTPATFAQEYLSEKKLFFLGNGASASMAAHFSTDFTKNGNIASFSNIEGSFITCFSNDYSYENAYMEILKRLMKDGDGLITISSSGSSPNLLISADYVRENLKNSPILTFTSFNPQNALREKGDYNLYVKADDYSFAESSHAYYLHLLTDLFTRKDKYNLSELLETYLIKATNK